MVTWLYVGLTSILDFISDKLGSLPYMRFCKRIGRNSYTRRSPRFSRYYLIYPRRWF